MLIISIVQRILLFKWFLIEKHEEEWSKMWMSFLKIEVSCGNRSAILW